MQKTIDCLIIGPKIDTGITNRTNKTGEKQDLDHEIHSKLKWVQYKEKRYVASELYNELTKDNYERISYKNVFILAIAYLGNYLNKFGFSFEYIKNFNDQKDDLSAILCENEIKTIAITTTFYETEEPIIEIISFIRKFNTSAKIIVGGPFILKSYTELTTLYKTDYVNKLDRFFGSMDADYFVISPQGEGSLVEILKYLDNKIKREEIDNIYYKDNDQYKSNQIIKEQMDLSENVLDWDLFAEEVGDFIPIRTSVSCPFRCSFCLSFSLFGKYQRVKNENIIKELKCLDKYPQVQNIDFTDDTLNYNKKRFMELLEQMIEHNFGFNWHCQFRVQFADREIVELMKKSGCVSVLMGLESGSNQILKNMNKGVTVEQYRKGIELLHEHDIITVGSFIIGFPGETEQTVNDTINFINETKIDLYTIQPWIGFPISPILSKENREKFKIKGEYLNWSHGTMDFKKACELRDKVFLDVKNSLFFNDDLLGQHLVHFMLMRGISLQNIKEYWRAFNLGVKERILSNGDSEIRVELIDQMKKSLGLTTLVNPNDALNSRI